MKKINIEELQFNPFTKIGKEWFLVGAKNKENKFNAMTASWGSIGVLWSKNIVNVYVRPQRYTKEFIDSGEYFTLNFFDEKYKKELSLYGTKSGREMNKEEACGFHIEDVENSAHVKEANLVFVCKKIYETKINPELMIDPLIDEKCYPLQDYHTVYVAEIVEVLSED